MSRNEFDHEKLHEMTASYSEISFDSPPSESPDMSDEKYGAENFVKNNKARTRPDFLDLKTNDDQDIYTTNVCHKAIDYLESEGTVMKDGDLVLFVAEDLENKIKLSSPTVKKNALHSIEAKNTALSLYKLPLTKQFHVLDPNILNELENEARRIATSVDSITESLSAILHSVNEYIQHAASALTVGCLETYRDAVCKTCDTIDFNIKSMYQLMAKSEELSKTMGIIYSKSEKLKDMKKMLDLFETTMN